MRHRKTHFPKFKPTDRLALFPAAHVAENEWNKTLVVLIDESFDITKVRFNKRTSLFDTSSFSGKLIYSEMDNKPVGTHNHHWSAENFRLISLIELRKMNFHW